VIVNMHGRTTIKKTYVYILLHVGKNKPSEDAGSSFSLNGVPLYQTKLLYVPLYLNFYLLF
jgi:hypothetical protein